MDAKVGYGSGGEFGWGGTGSDDRWAALRLLYLILCQTVNGSCYWRCARPGRAWSPGVATRARRARQRVTRLRTGSQRHCQIVVTMLSEALSKMRDGHGASPSVTGSITTEGYPLSSLLRAPRDGQPLRRRRSFLAAPARSGGMRSRARLRDPAAAQRDPRRHQRPQRRLSLRRAVDHPAGRRGPRRGDHRGRPAPARPAPGGPPAHAGC